MKKLEEEPRSYKSQFTQLTKGINLKAQEWILSKVDTNQSILEAGCGTGLLAHKLALKGNTVRAIDKNPKMIEFASDKYQQDKENNLTYQVASIEDLPVDQRSQDIIISTFMLSELRPFEQQTFLRNAWKALKEGGKLILASEFIASGIWKLGFKLKRWRYKKKLERLKLPATHPLENFYQYLEPIGFKILNETKWNHGTIHVLELQKTIRGDLDQNDEEGLSKNKPGYYRPESLKFKGLSSQLKIYRCLFTGQIDNVPIEPGIYQSGNPDKESPIIVTANYYYTYAKVMRNLEGIDAWVLCVDTNGINVWCAARGGDFGNQQLLEAINATNIQDLTDSRTLILPQLAAGGVALPKLPEDPKDFPFSVEYGPIWSKYLKEYLKQEGGQRKTPEMKRAKFTLSHRIRAGVTHTTFLFRKIFAKPLIVIFLALFLLNYFNFINRLWWMGDLILWLLIPNLLIPIIYPLSQFTRKFIFKGTLFGTINIFLSGFISWVMYGSLLYSALNSILFFWITFFSTMSFSGYTMSTNPRKIQEEYSTFRKINVILLLSAIILTFLSLVFI
ncbi:MAG: methyltransferase domain-containing protein [Promethearchaeia archaeon]